ncbi:MAG: tRNA (guanosine(37)-N1)-methyltransferase TrmD [Candidatus Eremiobacteraeota bacterium]|nr:tRNA (guanosine(37)-N1)-methyltransferase TrmD [Candidatus Eremiobacteraeota bacterium]MCW5872237.1 tRNA (guanosine(37)-N1)-methyltransferase TrmD [Candidatus Eremiobacteraeota bacterium]
MRIDVLTLFPEIFTPLHHSIPGRAQKFGAAKLVLHGLRQWGLGKHQQLDDTPYGGGPGMVMSCPPLFAALREVQSQAEPGRIIYLTPQGKPLTQERVIELAAYPRLLLLCGHYEGIDERVIEHWVEEEICIGDFVVSGGELPAMMLIDAIFRLLPGVLSEGSAEQDSFYHGLLDHPHYTKPANFEGREVPPVLLSGHHARVEQWRREQSIARTRTRRPDLFERWKNEEAKGSVRNTAGDRLEGVSYGQEISSRRRSRDQEENPHHPGRQAGEESHRQARGQGDQTG